MTTFQAGERSNEYYSITEFTGYLQKPELSSKQNLFGWVFWYPKIEDGSWNDLAQVTELPSQTEEKEKEKIRCVMEAVTSSESPFAEYFLVQFWGRKQSRLLTTVNQPFCVAGPLYKGYSWYRKLCEDLQYSLKEEVGAVGRAYLSGKPESTSDLRLYSATEFPLRNDAARCGLRTYLALPVFDMHTHKCYGVLEFVSLQIGIRLIFSEVDQALKKAGFRSTLTGFSSIPDPHDNSRYHQSEREVAEMMELAMELVPQLHLVQAWSPCKQCANTSNSSSCMQRISFIEARGKTLNSKYLTCDKMRDFIEACGLHLLQIGKWIGKALMSVDNKSYFCRNICDFSISENPLAHYAQRARLSFCFVVHLQDVHHTKNHYFVEFFFQSNGKEDAFDDSFLHLLLKLMEMELKNFKFEKSIVELRKTSALTAYEHVKWKHQHSEGVNMLMAMKGHTERYSVSQFRTYLQKDDLCYLGPCGKNEQGWLFWTEKISDNRANDNTTLPIFIQEKIKNLMKAVATKWRWTSYGLLQFWGVGMKEDRPCLETSDQPFALSSLDKGLAFFRKESMEYRYFLDEEVGPLQRVFRSGHPEISPNLHLYSTTEFPLRDHAVHCHLRSYIAFPILDQRKKCIGVLECVGYAENVVTMIYNIQRSFMVASLGSTHIDLTRSSATCNVCGSKSLTKTEIGRALQLLKNIPQLFLVDVWVTYDKCKSSSSNVSCMELFHSLYGSYALQVNFHQVQARKGIVGMVLASENKSIFCHNLCHFSVADEPRSHYLQQHRMDVCFAICLKSSHTGNLLYVLQFFLYPGPAKYEYVSSFLQILFPILKQELTSFKVASGQQLGDDLVVDVIQFAQQNELTSSELDESYSSPFKFRNVLYGQNEPQHSYNELPHFDPDVMDVAATVPPAKTSDSATSNFREKDGAKEKVGKKRNGSLHISLEDLQPHFGKTLKQVAEALGVGKSTIKRACRRNDIDRWPCNEKYIKNPSLFEAAPTSQDLQHSRSSNHPPPMTNLLPNNAETTELPEAELRAEYETVMVKAKYEDEIIKFKLCLSSKMNNLQQEVAKRLDLEIGSFKLKYLDEDDDDILLACDDDLQLCLKSLTTMNKDTVQLFVQLL